MVVRQVRQGDDLEETTYLRKAHVSQRVGEAIKAAQHTKEEHSPASLPALPR